MDAILRAALNDAVKLSGSPGAVAWVGFAGQPPLFHEAVGYRQLKPERLPATPDTVYDMASLTKVVATTTAALLLYEEGILDLDASVARYLPIDALKPVCIRHLLTHTAGLKSWMALHKECSQSLDMVRRFAEEGLEWEPGSRYRYTDAGYITLGLVVELAARDTLDAFCNRHIFDPLGMKSTRFNPPDDWASRCAATEDCPWRKQIMRGKVHDENAYALGGVSGHAGLFSTAPDLARFCEAVLSEAILKPDTLDAITRLGQVSCYPWQGLGWQLDPWSSGPTGHLPSRGAFGHTGFTGVCLWMDRATGLIAILLSNTCHPSRANANSKALRQTFFAAVESCFYQNRSSVHTGLDRLVREDFRPLRGQRVALLTHHAAKDQLGRHILDVMALAPDVRLHLLFSPEHGIRGQAEAGETVGSEAGDIPIVSLYARDKKAPSLDELAQVDCLVIDLQDVGARYYTYAATMRDGIAACLAANKPVIVLDRPNPVGGSLMEGPIAERDDSPVCWGRVPIRHGMTMGELAQWFAATTPGKGNASLVSVLTLDNWRRHLLYSQCALPWTPPSPNIPTPETALLYVGTCLFEGTNLNEGRGTDTPFQLIGAPWMDASGVLARLNPEDLAGCSVSEAAFTPQSLPGKASNPRYKDEQCQGIRIEVTDPGSTRPFRTTVALLCAIRSQHPKDLQFTDFFDVLAGTPSLRQAIVAGESTPAIVVRLEQGLPAFQKETPRLYP